MWILNSEIVLSEQQILKLTSASGAICFGNVITSLILPGILPANSLTDVGKYLSKRA